MTLKFDINMGLKDTLNLPTTVRVAVRAIVLRNDEILLVRSIRGDYKLPGGGVLKNEKHVDALIREISEETGYFNVQNIKEVGRVVEKKFDAIEEGKIFEMSSRYYTCEIAGDKNVQNLDEYEAKLKFVPEWISLDGAICANEMYIKSSENVDDWAEREILVLKRIQNMKKEDNI